MKKIIDFSLKNSVAMIMLTILVVITGYISTNTIKLENYPNVEVPTLMIQVAYPNHSSEEAEKDITLPIEEAIENIAPYEELTSTTQDNSTMIQVSYNFNEDMEEREREIQSAISKLKLPEDATLTYKRLSTSAKPIYQIALADEELTALQENITDTLTPQLQNIAGVSDVTVSGTTTSKLVVEVDEEKAAENGLTIANIIQVLNEKNYVLPLGSLEEEEGKIPVSMEGNLSSIEDMKGVQIPVAPSQQGIPPNEKATNPSQPQKPTFISLSEIAQIKEVEEENGITRYNGEPTLIVNVKKTQDANTAEVVELVKEEVKEFHASSDSELYTIIDQGKEVEKSVKSLLKEGGFGALFTIIIILLFLRNIRSTVIAILSLPISILGTIAVLDYFGYSLNIMTLGGIAVSVGRIVDDSIVVIENIFQWMQKKKNLSKRDIIFNATKEVIGAVTSSTVATIVVFLPLAFVGGIVGEFFKPFSIAVVTSIALSLLVAFMLIPVLALTLLKEGSQEEKQGWIQKAYDRLLRGSLNYKMMVIISAFVLLAGALFMVPAIGKSFLPSGPATALEVEVELPASTTLEKTNSMAKEIEELLMEDTAIEYVQGSVGLANNSNPLKQKASSDYKATFFIQLKDGYTVTMERKGLEDEIAAQVTKTYEESTLRINEVQQEGPPSSKTIDITLYGENLEALLHAADQVKGVLQENDQLTDVSSSAQQLQTKYKLELKEEAVELGVDQFTIYQQVNEKMNELSAGVMNLDKKELEVFVTYNELVRDKKELENTEILTQQGPKPLIELATIEEMSIPATIQHKDGKLAYTLSAESVSEEVGVITEQVEGDLASIVISDEVEWEVGGGQEMMTEGFYDLGIAMMIAVGLVFLTLTITYGGVITPFVILSSLIFVPIGSLGALLIAGETLSMSGMIGMLMLIGIVVTNAVVMLDRVEANRISGMALEHAVIEACNTRFRPIIMTALATILALVPLALSTSSSGVISKGLAITVIGGLTTSTLLTLVFIPVLYSIIGKWRRFS
ncbi:efflux RND transporter permease subunit [Sutcliffiella horikoshii]|uniref:Efflux RND transporter permease subunit n=1 Tax=Sutcliffiella horikoshii TaxID=79883 RepID=A0AA94WMZ3_9BACI|nr:efflux RND transporter permease subunit [Sutcliffiella horikoshii]TYS58080.1 efflux RND transporter permease subunit [Sutcliffiella horikoshii]